MQSKLFGVFREILKEKSEPVLIDITSGEEDILSAANIYTSVLARIKDLKRSGFKDGMVLLSEPTNFSAFIDFMTCCYFGASYFPVNKTTKEKVINQEFFECKTFESGDDFFITLTNSWHEENKTYPLMLATSGTKQQKVVSYDEDGILFQLEEHASAFSKYEHETKLSLLPKFHCFGLVLDLLLGVYMKKYITFIDPQKQFKDISIIIKEYDIDFISVVPKQIDLLMNISEKDFSIKDVLKNVHLFYGGAPIGQHNKFKAKKIFKNVIEGYGFTEAGPGVLLEGKPLRGVKLSIKNDLLIVDSPSIATIANTKKTSSIFESKDYFKFKNEKYIFKGRSGSLIKNSKGVFEHFSDVQNKIYKKYKREVLFFYEQSKTVIIDYYETEPLEERLKEWIYSEYPSVGSILSFKKDEGVELLQKYNGKAKEDIILKHIIQEGDKIWVG